MAVQFNAATQTLGTASSFTLQHNAQGSFRAVVVAVSTYNHINQAYTYGVTGITYGGIPLSKITGRNQSGRHVELWGLVNPPTGQQNVVVNIHPSMRCVIGVVSLTGVEQQNPWRNTNTNAGTASTGTVSVTSYADDMVLGAIAVDAMEGGITKPSTQRWHGEVNLSSYYGYWGEPLNFQGTGSTKPGEAITSFAWSFFKSGYDEDFADSRIFAAAAVSVRGLTPQKVTLTNIGGEDEVEQNGAVTVDYVGGYWVMGEWETVEYLIPADPIISIAGLGGMGLGGAPISGAEERYIRIRAIMSGRGSAQAKAWVLASGKAVLPGTGTLSAYFRVFGKAVLHGQGGLTAQGIILRDEISGTAVLVARGSLGAVGRVMKVDDLEFTGQLAPGDTLIIDMQTMTAKLNGQNAVHQLSGNFFELLSGENIVEVLDQTTGRKVRLRIDYQDKYL